MFIYHVALPEDWEQQKHRSFYEAASLESEGFIHCSFEDQLEGVIERYFRAAPELCILKIDIVKLTSKLVAEPSTNNEEYPHVYGPIDTSAIVNVERRPNRVAIK
jgi:uncharacterized protein (DUF952 family)